jgi:hypothetical protein
MNRNELINCLVARKTTRSWPGSSASARKRCLSGKPGSGGPQ